MGVIVHTQSPRSAIQIQVGSDVRERIGKIQIYFHAGGVKEGTEDVQKVCRIARRRSNLEFSNYVHTNKRA